MLNTLERRLTPAGHIDAVVLPNGQLRLTGDDDNNVVQILVTNTGVTLTPDLNTSINTHAAGDPENLGPITSIKADFRGGNDDVSIDPGQPFQVAGPVSFTLGDGNNTLDLSTSGVISLGSLTVTGGDGSDDFTLTCNPTNSLIKGATKLTYGNGGSSTSIDSISLSSLTISAGDAVTIPNDVTLTSVNVAKTIKASLGNSNPAIFSVADSTIGGLNESGYIISADLQNTVVLGSVTVKGGFQADLSVENGCTIQKNASVTAPNASLDVSGDGSLFIKNVSVTGTALSETTFESDTETEIQGTVSVKGGWYNDTFDANSNFKVDANISLKLFGGDNSVTIGDGADIVDINGSLSIDTTTGSDTIALDNVSPVGAVKIRTGAGADTLSIEDGSEFHSLFTADLGSGDDTISIAQNVGGTSPLTPVQFAFSAKITAGTGNDTLLLGLALGSGGDAGTNVQFAPSSIVDGGLGLDNFDSGNAQFSGVTPTGWNP